MVRGNPSIGILVGLLGAKTEIPVKKNILGMAAPLLLAVIAAVLLLWGLSNKYLWQDEAATAVLSQRMLQFGRPLAYDGVNLITIDYFKTEEPASIAQRTTDPQAAVQYYIHRGDYKADTSWRFQPWGQFVVTAISLKTLGSTTLAARLPFALAGIATVLLLYRFVLANFGNPLMALLAALFLVFNAYWILHARQCRYYSLSCLFLMITLMAYARWQWGGRWGAAAFVLAAWCWFQVDYGTFWPVMLVLFVDAFVAERHNLWRPALVGTVLAVAIAPFLYYFELWRRKATPVGIWSDRFSANLFDINEYVAPLMIVFAAIALLVWRWPSLAAAERRLVAIASVTILAFTLWVPLAAPVSFLRYVIILAPLGCLLAAWVLVQSCGPRTGLAWLGAAILIVTPWMSKPLHLLISPPRWFVHARFVRPELRIMGTEVFGHRPDPNRIVIEWLKQNASPSDEILINYEDVPLMFYLPNPIRGGVAAFRAEDDAKVRPEFVILRRSVPFLHWPVYRRELGRYQWSEVTSVRAPDIIWGNNPDPVSEARDPAKAPTIYIARRITH